MALTTVLVLVLLNGPVRLEDGDDGEHPQQRDPLRVRAGASMTITRLGDFEGRSNGHRYVAPRQSRVGGARERLPT